MVSNYIILSVVVFISVFISIDLIFAKGDNKIVIVPGANTLLSPADVDEAEDAVRNAAVLLAQFETSLETTLRALELHKGHGIFCFLNYNYSYTEVMLFFNN